MEMNVTVASAGELSPEHVAAWSRIREAEPTLRSPFFRPEFTQIVASVRDDVEVAVFEQAGNPVGFFPFHRDKRNVAKSVGLDLSDYEGVVIPGDAPWTAEQLLQGCRLKAWRFRHLVVTQKPLLPYHWIVGETSYLDLSRGFEVFQNVKQRLGQRTISRVQQKLRKTEREVGPLQLVGQTRDETVLEQLFQWRMEQYRQCGCMNYLAEEWTCEVLRRVVSAQEGPFAGMMSALYAGDHLLAVHLGMRNGGLLHGWFPAFNPAFSEYSPGLLLWVRLAQASRELGLTCIDLGMGTERYKQNLRSGTLRLAEGAVDARRARAALFRGWLELRERIRSSPLRGPVQGIVRSIRRWYLYRQPPWASGTRRYSRFDC